MSTWPVTGETVSMVPSMGERATLLNHRIQGRVSAITSSRATASPSPLSMYEPTSPGVMPSRFTTLRLCTSPGSSARATTSSAATRAPGSTNTSPAMGSRRSLRTVVRSVTRRPGV